MDTPVNIYLFYSESEDEPPLKKSKSSTAPTTPHKNHADSIQVPLTAPAHHKKHKEPRKQNVPFQRVDASKVEFAHEKLMDNRFIVCDVCMLWLGIVRVEA